MSELCCVLGITVRRTSELSDRVCTPCGRKIRNASELFTFIATEINVIHTAKEEARVKRQLPTTVSSPERSPSAKKVLKVAKSEGRNIIKTATKKSLFDKENIPESDVNDEKRQLDRRTVDHTLSAMNIDYLVDNNTMQTKTVVVYPNGRVETHQWFDDITKYLVINLSQKK